MTVRNKNALRTHPIFSRSMIRAGLIAPVPPSQLESDATGLPLAYVIWRRDEAGLLSVLGTVLRGLEVARWLGATPIVDMTNFFTAYGTDSVPQQSNFWNQLFEPLSALRIEDLDRNAFRILFSDGNHAEKSVVDPERIFDFQRDYRAHIRFSEETRRWIENRTETLALQDDVIGVHYRGGDMRTAPRHPLPPTAQQLIRRTKALLDSGEYNSVFLATNVARGRKVFQKAFGGRLKLSPAHNELGSRRLPFSVPKGIAGVGRRSAAQRLETDGTIGLATARDVLVDVVALSRCGALVCGASNVSLMAKVFADDPFRELSIVDNGQNGTSRLIAYTQWYVKRVLPSRLGGFDA